MGSVSIPSPTLRDFLDFGVNGYIRKVFMISQENFHVKENFNVKENFHVRSGKFSCEGIFSLRVRNTLNVMIGKFSLQVKNFLVT